jgi:hypothetical protein
VSAPADTSASSNLSSPSAAVAGDWQGRHTMTGEVTRINQSKGTFSLKTAEGTLDLHAPLSVLAGVKNGDQWRSRSPSGRCRNSAPTRNSDLT